MMVDGGDMLWKVVECGCGLSVEVVECGSG